jgi:hypothetical protein
MLVAVLLVSSAIAGAQQTETSKKLRVKPFATASFELLSNMGYKNPSLGGGTGVEIRKGRFLTINSADMSWARKQLTTGGYSNHFSNDTFVQLRNFLLGGGMSWARQSTDQWSKASVHPALSGGFYCYGTRLIGDFYFAGTDEQNATHGAELSWEIPIKRSLSAVEEFGFWRSHATGDLGGPTHWGSTFRLSLKIAK